jgi:hypothetical protein
VRNHKSRDAAKRGIDLKQYYGLSLNDFYCFTPSLFGHDSFSAPV